MGLTIEQIREYWPYIEDVYNHGRIDVRPYFTVENIEYLEEILFVLKFCKAVDIEENYWDLKVFLKKGTFEKTGT